MLLHTLLHLVTELIYRFYESDELSKFHLFYLAKLFANCVICSGWLISIDINS